MHTITTRFDFSAAHHIDGLPAGHPCSRPHGHNYAVELVLSAPALTGPGFVLDYGDLAPFGRWLDDTLDHRDLNDVLPCTTTAENIAAYLFATIGERWPAWPLAAVRVSETGKTWAEYRP